MSPTLTIESFKKVLLTVCAADTSADASQWTPENPLYGHCAVASLVAQKFFGGMLLRGSLEGTPFADMSSHYWNRFSDGHIEDFTGAQFGGYPIMFKTTGTRERAYLLSYPATKFRYELLLFRVIKAFASNKLFDDEIYRRCFYRAQQSPCQKMNFGCALFHNEKLLAEACNTTIEGLESFCDPKCIRLSIASRTESMIGACGHAEESAIWRAAKMGVDFPSSSLYIAGFSPQALPYIKETPDFTCLRCAVVMSYAGLGKIFMPVRDKWVGVTVADALASAKRYATGEKKV